MPKDTKHLLLDHVTECLIQVYLTLAFFHSLLLVLFELVMALPFLFIHVVVGQNVAVGDHHEVLVQDEFLVWLVQLPVLLVHHIHYLLVVQGLRYHDIIE